MVNWVSSLLSFFLLSTYAATTYIFTAPTCTSTIIILEPCALNAEFQHFILRFHKIFVLCGYHWKQRGQEMKAEGIRGEREGDFTDNFNTNWTSCCRSFNLHSFITCTTSHRYDIYSTLGDIKWANDVDASSWLFVYSWDNHLATTNLWHGSHLFMDVKSEMARRSIRDGAWAIDSEWSTIHFTCIQKI